MKKLIKKIHDVKPNRIIANCGECESCLIDSRNFEGGRISLVKYIESLALKHEERTGHNDFQIYMNKKPQKKEINITINE